jgi:CRP-like cAMP-binding protein
MDQLVPLFRSESQVRLYKKGTNILFQSEIPRKAFIVRQGIIRAYTIKASGEESIVAFFVPGDIFPLPWLLGTTSNVLFYYEAVTDCRVMSFSKDSFNKAVDNDPKLLKDMLGYVNKKYTSSLVHINALGQSRAIEKMGFTFYYLLIRHGVEKAAGQYEINIKLNHLTIANLTGLTRESVTKNLKILTDKGIVTYNRTELSVNKPKLEAFIGEDGFHNLKLT